jgi:glycosyltransferase involved in cell wall biosynthesis
VTVIARLEPGGAQLSFLRLALELEHRGFEHVILAGEVNAEGLAMFNEPGFPIEAYGLEGAQYACDEGFASWIRPRLAGAAVVHARMFGAWWAASRAVPDAVPLVASEHNAIRWPGEPREEQMRAALDRVDRFVAHSPAARDHVLRLGFDPSRLIDGLSPISIESPRPLPWLRSPRVVFAGRLHPEKGPDVLIEALSRLEQPPATYLLGCGPMDAFLRRLAAERGLSGVVRFCGWRRRPARWLRGASVCVVPSRHEAWSQTAVTAMWHRVPVIGTSVEGLPQTLSEDRGILVPPEDPEALAAAIEGVMSGQRMPDLDAAHAYSRRFSPALVASQHADLYRELLAQPRIARGSRAMAA